ncbi:atg15p [Lichtheimia corymbifera JMRC:FSU:9682]|uniref:triacylglycerol lipase n=1 Tax=Lichtheimia corymbifera JMRC:FSU:9682 TaxID=1263082 RepID=A0A068S4Q7_9FUNG|nr:atg15p [Lichtheimia corymbifera JMRC:FSU:9682]
MLCLCTSSHCTTLHGGGRQLYTQTNRNRQPGIVFVNKSLELSQQSVPLVTPYDAFQLQTIYHHASPSGPIPGLFRKLELSNQGDMLRNDPFMSQGYHVNVQRGAIYRPVSLEYLYDMYRHQQHHGDRAILTWTSTMDHALTFDYYLTHGMLPDISHKASVLALAMMARNAYHDKIDDRGDWYDLGAPWNLNESFGWESDGIRGHVFGNRDKSIFIISIKGSSSGKTRHNDSVNEKLLFSCCCGNEDHSEQQPTCDCKMNENACDNHCLENRIKGSEFYYDMAMRIYKDISDRHPQSTIWLTGHSLGGAVASLVGQTFLVPIVSFGIPGDQFAARKLHLPHAPGLPLPVWHYGHTADPIFAGKCSNVDGGCRDYIAETQCHTGKVCEWDTVKDKGWDASLRHHQIEHMIEYLLKDEESSLPECKPENKECSDCGQWKYVDSRDQPAPHHSSTAVPSPTHTSIPASPEPTICSWW